MGLLNNPMDNENAFGLTNLLEDYPNQPFVDEIHFTSDVCDQFAEFIAHKIKIPSPCDAS
jgi:hypothetical protein